ncbi:MAG: methyltransferase domain-containing protein [Oscillospiraceae bacterium]|nr:methyltransferase domain-containing protein [Oscillospiraceae bacterium]
MLTHHEPDSFELEENSLWSFPERGCWATHDAKYRGNWSPYVPRNLILRYTTEKELILDQFAGGGTTLIEAKLLNRNIIGVDINPTSLERCRKKTTFMCDNAGSVYIKNGDARKLDFIPDKSIDFICTHPPYANIVKYSDGISGDISNFGLCDFLTEMRPVADECYRVLKPKKYCAILMGDTRKGGHIITLSFDVMKIFKESGFNVKEIVIKEQHNCKYTDRWKKKSYINNFLLIAHEYLFVFQK